MEIKIKVPQLHPGQKLVNDNAKRFNVLCCGRRWGKTKFGVCRLLVGKNGIISERAYPCAWFAPSYRYIDDVWDEIITRCAPIIEYKNKSSGRIKFITGATLDFWAMGEDKGVARGRRYARVIIDEAAHIRYLQEAWEKSVEPTLTDFRGEAWFVSTPNGINYFTDLYNRKGDDWISWSMPSTSNPYLSLEEIENKRENIPELVYRQEYLAEFVTFGAGLVKPEYIINERTPPLLPVVLGVDLAISEKTGADYTAIVAMARDQYSGLIYVKEAQRVRAGFNEVLNIIKAAAERHKPYLVAIEEAQFQAAVIQELTRTTKIPVRGIKPDRDKLTRFLPLLTRYEQKMVRHDPSGVPAWFRDELLAFPEGQHDDGVDAAAYAFLSIPAKVNYEYHPVENKRRGVML